MIDLSLIDDMFDTIGTSISRTFIRADQDGDRPEGVYCTYKIISEPEEDIRSVIRENVAIDANNTRVTLSVKSEPVISINIIGDINAQLDGSPVADLDVCRTVASEILKYYRFNTFADFVVLDILTDVQDRTTYLDSEYEPRMGFDIKLNYCETQTQDTESMNIIEVTPTIDNEIAETEQPLLTITKP